MEFGQIIILFISYAIIQSAYLIFKFFRKKRNANGFDVFLVSLLSIVIIICLDHLYMYFGWYKTYPLIIWWVVPFWFLIAPLFFHTIKFFFLEHKFSLLQLLHYLPFFFIAWRYKAGFLTSKDIKLEYYSNMMNQGFEPSEPHYLLVLQLLIYAIWCLILMRKTWRSKKQTESNSIYDDYIVAYRLVLLFLVFVISLGVDLFIMYQTTELTIMKHAGIELVFISVIVIVLSNWLIKNKHNFKLNKDDNIQENEKYFSSSLAENDLDEILSKLEETIINKELFKNPELRIYDLSEEVNIKSHHISQAINQIKNKNFFDYINEFRVEALKKAIRDGKDLKNYSMFGLANNYGFKSGSSFYRIFKKHTGQTPGQYKAKHEK